MQSRGAYRRLNIKVGHKANSDRLKKFSTLVEEIKKFNLDIGYTCLEETNTREDLSENSKRRTRPKAQWRDSCSLV